MADTIGDQRLELRGSMLLQSQRKNLVDHQMVALSAPDELEGLSNLISPTQATTYEQLNEIHYWLERPDSSQMPSDPAS